MNPDLDQFDLDVRVTTPRELATDAEQFGTTTLHTCITCKNCGITTSAPGN